MDPDPHPQGNAALPTMNLTALFSGAPGAPSAVPEAASEIVLEGLTDLALTELVSHISHLEGLEPPKSKGLAELSHRSPEVVFPRSIDELMNRVAVVKSLYDSGSLAREAERFGIRPSWLAEHFREPPSVAMTEQQMALPTLFGKLGTYGSPAALGRALRTMGEIAARLSELHGEEVDVSIGMRTSHDHAVTFKAITSGFYFVAPLVAPGRDGEIHQRAHLFSNSDEARFRGVGYRDLSLGVAKLAAVEKIFADIAKLSGSECSKAEKAMHRQEIFNSQRSSAGSEVTADMQARVQESERLMLRHGARASAAEMFLIDFRAARTECAENGTSERIPYNKFMEALNARIAARFLPQTRFETGYGEAINALPTNGIADWPKFLRAFLEADILRTDEPILRFRVIAADGAPAYRILMLESIEGEQVKVRDRESGEIYSVHELVAQSKASMESGKGPLLLPIAAIRYAANYGMSGSVGLDDGMPYELVQRVSAAFRNPLFTEFPRELTVYPYTRLTDFTPQNPSDPYDGFKVQYDVLDYYIFADRINRRRHLSLD